MYHWEFTDSGIDFTSQFLDAPATWPLQTHRRSWASSVRRAPCGNGEIPCLNAQGFCLPTQSCSSNKAVSKIASCMCRLAPTPASAVGAWQGEHLSLCIRRQKKSIFFCGCFFLPHQDSFSFVFDVGLRHGDTQYLQVTASHGSAHQLLGRFPEAGPLSPVS